MGSGCDEGAFFLGRPGPWGPPDSLPETWRLLKSHYKQQRAAESPWTHVITQIQNCAEVGVQPIIKILLFFSNFHSIKSPLA